MSSRSRRDMVLWRLDAAESGSEDNKNEEQEGEAEGRGGVSEKKEREIETGDREGR